MTKHKICSQNKGSYKCLAWSCTDTGKLNFSDVADKIEWLML